MKTGTWIVRKVRDIRWGVLASGAQVNLGTVSMHGKRLTVASMTRERGSWWTVQPEQIRRDYR